LLGVRDADELAARLASGAQGPLVVRRNIDGVGKRIDVAQYLLEVCVGEDAATLQRAGLLGELTPVRMRLRVTPSGTAKPSETLEALLGRNDVPARFVRARLLCNQGDEQVGLLELARLRELFAQARGVPESPLGGAELASA
jgi:hypothetical protein